jgi:serine/threonine-protein kinase
MPFSKGDQIGSYEVVSLLGHGGMGEVYRARDTTLKRDVALKVLPAAFLRDPERMARFQREAEVLASLDHPNIGPIFGLVDSADSRALVLALVEGPTLADRIDAGPLPQDEALAIAKQIIEALEYAHDHGVVHRDLKPSNVKITPDGVVKVLDFGLAKVLEDEPPASSLANSPTLTIGHTRAGMILGTAAYMSPEQAVGRAVDRRSDIFSFGAVIYEMLTGSRAFKGAATPDVLEAVVKTDPDWSKLPPGAIDRLVRRCLTKDRKQRLQAIGEARIALEHPEPGHPEPSRDREGAVPEAPRLAKLWPVAAALLAITTALALWYRPSPIQKTTARLTIPLPPGQELTSYPAITRDGKTIAYVTQQGTEDSQLYLRDLNSFEARPVPGSSGAKQPFFSPDGKWVAFFAQGQLQKAEVAGGSPIRVAEAGYPFGGTWSEDHTIIYTTSLGSGLVRIPATGGTPQSLTKPDGGAKGYAHVFPQGLPGGRSVFFRVWGQTQGGVVLPLSAGPEESSQWEMVLPETVPIGAVFSSSGDSKGRLLVGDQDAGIKAAPFDGSHPARTSADTSVLANVFSDIENESQPWLAVSGTGTAVYAAGNPNKTSLVWVDREGKTEPLGTGQNMYREARLSPDGSKAVVRHGLDLWVHDLQRGTRSRLTPPNVFHNWPLWSRDGKRIIFGSNRGGDWDIYSQPADGSTPAEVLLKRPYDQFPYSVAADGTLLYAEIHPKTGRDLWSLSPDGKTSPVRVTPFNEGMGQFSPGPESTPRWVAYASDESGRSEVYVQSYPSGANKVAVSTGGGFLPQWSRDGKELFYVTGDALVAVAVGSDGSFGTPRRLFDRSNYFFKPNFSIYDVSPDGKRFLMIQRDPGSVPRQLNVILNWSEELDRLVPVAK